MRFKKGDRVRVVNDRAIKAYGPRNGDTGTVLEDSCAPFFKWDKSFGENWAISENQIELVPVAAATSTFKVGDRVRYVNRKYGEATVIAITPIGIQVDTGGEYGICTEKPSSLELVDWDFDPRTATPLKIEAGKFYKTRDGRKVGPMEEGRYGGWFDKSKSLTGYPWDANGVWLEGQVSVLDLIAEWTSSCAAAQVDNLRDEYGPFTKPAATAGNDNGKPKFKVGDRVRMVRYAGYVGTVKASPGDGYRDEPSYSVHWDWYGDGSQATTWYESELEPIEPKASIFDSMIGRAFTFKIATPATPAIVALIENGQPLPSNRPHVHPNKDAASTEANRLARKYPGKEFGVYELVGTKKESVVYSHEWQRLAASGEKIRAIKELRGLTGLGLKATKDAVEGWLDREAA